MKWYEAERDVFSPVLSTRVRFARNLADTPFPGKLDEAGRQKVFDRVRETLADKDVTVIDFGTVGDLEKNAYVQTHLASAALARAGKGAGLLLSRDGESAVLVNEEDHLRLQVILPGKQIRETYEKALRLPVVAGVFCVFLIATYAFGFNLLCSYNLQSSFQTYSFYDATWTPIPGPSATSPPAPPISARRCGSP